MKLTKEICSQIPNMRYLKFISNGSSVKLACWDDGQVVAASVIDNATIAKDAIIDSKTIRMIKELASMQDVEVEINKSVKVSNKYGTYRGKIIDSGVLDIKVTYDIDNEKILSITNEDLFKAYNFTNKKDKSSVLSGINVSETHITSTDKYCAYLNGVFSKDNISLSPNLLEALKGLKFEEIAYSGKQVRVVAGDFTYFGNIFEQQYPLIEKAFEIARNGVDLNIGYEELKEPVTLALKSVSKEDIIKLDCVDGNTKISTNDFEACIESSCSENFEFYISQKELALLLEYAPENIKFNSGSKPLYATKGNTEAIFTPIKRGE